MNACRTEHPGGTTCGNADPLGGQAASVRDLAPLLRRSVELDPLSLVRIRLTTASARALVRLPFGVLAGRTVRADGARPVDTTVGCADLLAWLDGGRAETPEASPAPAARDVEWRAGTPPTGGWRRIETVPDDVIRGLVRSGSLALTAAAVREGVPGAQPRAVVADALLDSVVLTVTAGGTWPATQISLRPLSALTRLGFLPRGSHVAIDLAGRWIRLAAEYGSVYIERPLSLQAIPRYSGPGHPR
jgi:hypothetical protein